MAISLPDKNALLRKQIIYHWINRGENQRCSAVASSSWWRNGYTIASGLGNDWMFNDSGLYLLCKVITHSFADSKGRSSHRGKVTVLISPAVAKRDLKVWAGEVHDVLLNQMLKHLLSNRCCKTFCLEPGASALTSGCLAANIGLFW